MPTSGLFNLLNANAERLPVPAHCRKLVHRWKDRQRLPNLERDAGHHQASARMGVE
jgi:hypothetical protein